MFVFGINFPKKYIEVTRNIFREFISWKLHITYSFVIQRTTWNNFLGIIFLENLISVAWNTVFRTNFAVISGWSVLRWYKFLRHSILVWQGPLGTTANSWITFHQSTFRELSGNTEGSRNPWVILGFHDPATGFFWALRAKSCKVSPKRVPGACSPWGPKKSKT